MQNNKDTNATSNNIVQILLYIIASLIVNSLPFIALFILCFFIIPGYIDMFESAGADLPVALKSLFQLSGFITAGWFLYIIMSAFLVMLLSGLFAFFYIKQFLSRTKILIIHAVLGAGLTLLIILLFCLIVYLPAMDIQRAISML